MGLAVITVAAGGLPVVDVTAIPNLPGIPITERAAALGGVAVTKVSAALGGLPVRYVAAPLLLEGGGE